MKKDDMNGQDRLEYNRLVDAGASVIGPLIFGGVAILVNGLAYMIWKTKLTLFLLGCSGIWTLACIAFMAYLLWRVKQLANKYKGEKKK